MLIFQRLLFLTSPFYRNSSTFITNFIHIHKLDGNWSNSFVNTLLLINFGLSSPVASDGVTQSANLITTQYLILFLNMCIGMYESTYLIILVYVLYSNKVALLHSHSLISLTKVLLSMMMDFMVIFRRKSNLFTFNGLSSDYLEMHWSDVDRV